MHAAPSQHTLNLQSVRRGFVVLCAIVMLAAGCVFGTPASAAARGNTELKAPIRAFLMAYMQASMAGHYQLDTTLNVPALWLYSSKGELLARATTDAELAQLLKSFPPKGAQPLPNQPGLKVMLGAVAQASGNAAPAPAADGKRTAVLLVADSADCKSCAAFTQGLHQLEQTHAAQLRAATVTLTTH